jgi:hypothetical protein
LKTPKLLMAGSLLAIAINVAGAPPARAEPLTPLTPAELQYLDGVRRVLTVSHDNAAARSDGELLDGGRYACRERELGMVGQQATALSPAITQLAFIYLCPN